MNDSDDGAERWERRRRSRRLFMQSAGVVGFGLAAGPSIAAPRGDDEHEDDDTDATEESNGCPSTEIEPGLHEFVADDGEAGDDFGDSVAVDGDTAIVAPGNLLDLEQAEFHNFTADPATAYVFTRDGDGWCQQATLVADEGGSDGDDEHHLGGSAVSLDGDTAIVGDVNHDGTDVDTGAAFVFTRNGETWSQEAMLTAEDGQRVDRFGGAVSLDGDTAIVGAHLEDERGFQAGAAYVFTRDGETWSQEAKLTAEDGENLDHFGVSVALDGNRALVSAPYRAENGNWTGAAYVFARDGETWSQEAKLTAEDGAERDRFGLAVALDGDTALVSAPYHDENGEDAGATYVFVRDGESWSQEAKLVAEDGAAREQFGWSLGLDGDRAVVGMWHVIRGGAPATGAAYLFARDEGAWSQEATLLAPDGEDGDDFGRAVDLDDETILAGAPGRDEGAGSTYAFDRSTWEPTDPDEEETDEEPTAIDSCTVITEPGEYELVADLAPRELEQPACIVIDSDDVTLRGNGHTIDASDATHAESDYSEGYERPPCIAVHPYTNGLGEDNWNTHVADVVVTGGYAGVAARLSSGGHYEDVRAADNDHGFLFETDGGLVRNCVAEDNERGVTVTTWGFGGRLRADLEDCTVRNNGTGLWVDQEMDATAARCRIVENGTGVLAVPFALETDWQPPTVALEECHVCRNENYGVHARTDPLAEDADDHEQEREGVVLAVDNYWGAANGPSSFGDPPEPYADPETGRPADGDGDAVSQSLEPGVSNVRFDPFLEVPFDDVGARR
ncbi:right-handed parallel beta-helix repeat-containing protein [Natrononativus amylolyticus]|uniref:right-handed parallel beta-helix repeat-containing protein n=1 Tax=Natrononativus amylolyticus TaxID=2963434 RepID=UPI0020CCE714|nr:right-handed parallel beta-helix repeat-containing protein [Natrononativus amylolyticus]